MTNKENNNVIENLHIWSNRMQGARENHQNNPQNKRYGD